MAYSSLPVLPVVNEAEIHSDRISEETTSQAPTGNIVPEKVIDGKISET